MGELEKYQAVNKCTSLKELADVIRSFAIDGMIEGRYKEFDAERMAKACENYDNVSANSLTRKYGIRQQAMMISYYGDY
jgi:hypothetical protein